jgi:hypothetical protein
VWQENFKGVTHLGLMIVLLGEQDGTREIIVFKLEVVERRLNNILGLKRRYSKTGQSYTDAAVLSCLICLREIGEKVRIALRPGRQCDLGRYGNGLRGFSLNRPKC